MCSSKTNENRTLTSPLLGRETILILCAVLFWLFFNHDAGPPSATIALCGAVVGLISYVGLVFSQAERPSQTQAATDG